MSWVRKQYLLHECLLLTECEAVHRSVANLRIQIDSVTFLFFITPEESVLRSSSYFCSKCELYSLCIFLEEIFLCINFIHGLKGELRGGFDSMANIRALAPSLENQQMITLSSVPGVVQPPFPASELLTGWEKQKWYTWWGLTSDLLTETLP